ncbi:MAG: putative sporulation protein YtxC [Defluviitaleaceae bacterium]|nr:putative sporulation protein YtxC [Defluviitaleaceae bacterium]
MKRFSLYTVKYENVLREFAARTSAAEIIYINKNCKNQEGFALYFSVKERELFCEMLLGFLMDIAEGENPIYKHSARLRGMAGELRESPIFGRELNQLREFFTNSRELNIEGYVTFRMCEFREKLDMMIYSLVKKIKFGNED